MCIRDRGMIGVVRPEDLNTVLSSSKGSFVIGEVTDREPEESRIEFL